GEPLDELPVVAALVARDDRGDAAAHHRRPGHAGRRDRDRVRLPDPGHHHGQRALLSSGVPTILLLTVGLVIVPQGVARGRASGALDYQRSLPVARPLLLL